LQADLATLESVNENLAEINPVLLKALRHDSQRHTGPTAYC
jgi:hypothetical protein